MLFTSSILLGFMRLCAMLLFLFYVNRKWVSKSASNTFLEFLVHQWFRYGSIIGIVIFVTIQLSIYDLLNCVLILLFIIAVDIIGFRNLKNPGTYFDNKIKSIVHKLLKKIELNKSLSSWFVFKKKDPVQINGYFILLLVIVLTAITFISRFYFFKYDLYTLSGIWVSDLEQVVNFDNQKWFFHGMTVAGNLAFVNFYAKITDVSPEIALQSIGILESVLISVLLFWTIRTITFSKYMAPIIATFSFAMLYTIIPININFLLQSKSTFLALTFAFPSMVFLLKPGLLKLKKINYFFSFFLVFIVIGLIDLFTLCILLPPFLVISIFLTKHFASRRFWLGLAAYCFSVGIVFGIYALACYQLETDFMMFLHTNLLSVNSYTYIPQLVMPLNRLINYYVISAFIGIIFLLKFLFHNKEDWKASIAFLIYFITLILLGSIKNPWVDSDLLIQSLPAFIPIVIGINSAIIIRLFNPLFIKLVQFNKYAIGILVLGIQFFAIYYQKNTINKFVESDETPKQILDVYDQISSNYFPYTYAVVNDDRTQVISENKHFFMNYSIFLNDYLEQDSIYFKNIRNPKFFKKNPQNVIPKSVLLFVFINKKSGTYNDNDALSQPLMNQLYLLKKRNRKVELFYINENFKVYEIINEPKSSKISDLIF
ncbi:hypothetical protein [Flavobacterium sp.]|uniref:hypothetical protein n=1 Tax=Flavobacterium sp. TaxID=239 RepID=UPI002B4AE5ED|nr:hypothetical protein [Flavobacterium sp.]HLF52856.1 hypothetical protein [Flavobacterium sp.]